MADPIPLMVELCAGTAALSLRLHREGARPPVSRMGSKSGFSDALLRVLGLTPGQRAAAYLWCEPDPGVRLLLHAYRDAGLAKAAAAIIRSWAAEDPRALWERLRAEGPPRLPEGAVEAGEVARWQVLGAWAFRKGEPESGFNAGYVDARPTTATEHGSLGRTAEHEARMTERMPTALPATIAPDARTIDPREVARVIQIIASNELINVAWNDAEGRWKNTGNGGTTFGGPIGYGADRSPAKLDALPVLPAVVAPDAREVDPREVARWCNLAHYAHRQGEPESGFSPHLLRDYPATATNHGSRPRTVQVVADRFGVTPALPALIHPDARTIDPPALPPGTVVYLDGPYENTTQYAHLLPRAEQVTLARRWAAAGATVAVSEAEPIPELVAEGWYSVDITGERVGQRRTFGGTQEWVTLNRPPAWRPSVQRSLFGGDIKPATGRA